MVGVRDSSRADRAKEGRKEEKESERERTRERMSAATEVVRFELLCHEENFGHSQSTDEETTPPDALKAFGFNALSKACLEAPYATTYVRAKRLSGVYSTARTPKRRRRLDFSKLHAEVEKEDEEGGKENETGERSEARRGKSVRATKGALAARDPNGE